MIALKGFQLYFSTFLNTSWTLYDPVYLHLYQRKKILIRIPTPIRTTTEIVVTIIIVIIL